MLDFCLYLLVRAGAALLGLLPLPLVFVIGEILGTLAWIVLPNYRSLALRNVHIAFAEEKSAPEKRRLVRRHFARLGANLLCSVKMTAMSPEKLAARVTIENTAPGEAVARAGRPIVVVLSHLGSWELFAQVMPKLFAFVKMSTVYQRLGNRFIDAHVRGLRARSGLQLFERGAGFEKPAAFLRNGGCIGILSDQHAGNQGVWTPFFGRLASTTTLPALLAKRTGAAVISCGLFTVGRARWRMVFSAPLDDPRDSVESLTAKANAAIENHVRESPEDWFWVHNRWKTPAPFLLLSRYKRGVFLPRGTSGDKLKRFRVLIRSPNWLGDAVMSVDCVRALKHGRPDAHLTVAVPSTVSAVWKLVPEVDEVLPFASKSLLQSVRAIRARGRFDAAIIFPNSMRSALEVWLAGIPWRIGYGRGGRRMFLNQIVHRNTRSGRRPHQVLRYLNIARNLGATPKDVDGTVPPQSSPRNGAGSPRFALCPGAEYGPAKRWLPERFAQTAKIVAEKLNAKWAIVGTAKEAPIADAIAAELGDHCENRAGQTTLEQLIDELRNCSLLLTNDTGTMHLAALLGTPVVAVFGSTEPALTGPRGDQHIILRHHVECSPCFLRECPIDFRCMHAVTVAETVDAVVKLHTTAGAS